VTDCIGTDRVGGRLIREDGVLRFFKMSFTLTVGPLISLIAGILILIVPRALNYIVALYLILAGLLGLFGGTHFNLA
jgi:hypothetical protein